MYKFSHKLFLQTDWWIRKNQNQIAIVIQCNDIIAVIHCGFIFRYMDTTYGVDYMMPYAYQQAKVGIAYKYW